MFSSNRKRALVVHKANHHIVELLPIARMPCMLGIDGLCALSDNIDVFWICHHAIALCIRPLFSTSMLMSAPISMNTKVAFCEDGRRLDKLPDFARI